MTRRRNFVVYLWLVLGCIATAAGVIELVRISFGSSGAALTTYALVALGLGIVASASGTIRRSRAAGIALVVLLGFVSAYCGLFAIWVGAAYGLVWLVGAIAVGVVAVSSIVLLRSPPSV